MRLFQSNERYLENFPDVDKDKLGKRMAQGFEHTVYEYGDTEVLKIPFGLLAWGNSTASDQERNLDDLSQHFPEYVLPTQIITSRKGRQYCIKQKKVLLEPLTPYEEDLLVLKDFSIIIERNRKLVRDLNISVDFWGLRGVLQSLQSCVIPSVKPCLSNIGKVYDEEQKIALHDISMIRLSGHTNDISGMRNWLFNNTTFVLNRWFIKALFKEDIGSRKCF